MTSEENQYHSLKFKKRKLIELGYTSYSVLYVSIVTEVEK